MVEVEICLSQVALVVPLLPQILPPIPLLMTTKVAGEEVAVWIEASSAELILVLVVPGVVVEVVTAGGAPLVFVVAVVVVVVVVQSACHVPSQVPAEEVGCLLHLPHCSLLPNQTAAKEALYFVAFG